MQKLHSNLDHWPYFTSVCNTGGLARTNDSGPELHYFELTDRMCLSATWCRQAELDALLSEEGITNMKVEQLMISLHDYPFHCYSFITSRLTTGRISEFLTPGAL